MIGIQSDNHGNVQTLQTNIDMYGCSGMTVFHVGDFGYWLSPSFQDEYKYSKTLKLFNKFLKTRGITMYVIRGNHDNPAYFDGRFILSNVKLVPDYTVVSVNNENWLLVGGAISIDRGARKQGITYWKTEEFNLEYDKIAALRDIKNVVTHTAPGVGLDVEIIAGQVVKQFAWAYNDNTLLEEIRAERLQVQTMCDLLKENNDISKWYFGHFHIRMNHEYKGTKFTCVEIDALLEHR